MLGDFSFLIRRATIHSECPPFRERTLVGEAPLVVVPPSLWSRYTSSMIRLIAPQFFTMDIRQSRACRIRNDKRPWRLFRGAMGLGPVLRASEGPFYASCPGLRAVTI
jgi:hypothetical protein